MSARDIPAAQYAESDGISIAYQVFGSGRRDLVVVPGIVTHLEVNRESPDYARMLRQLAQTFRVIMFDKRGHGLSDSFAGVPTLDERVGARVRASAGAGEVLVSGTLRDLVAGSGIGFEARGSHALKGVPGAWALHRALVGSEPERATSRE
jgi:pimeloyl-ACP methyl ester carboxylesterase